MMMIDYWIYIVKSTLNIFQSESVRSLYHLSLKCVSSIPFKDRIRYLHCLLCLVSAFLQIFQIYTDLYPILKSVLQHTLKGASKDKRDLANNPKL